MKHTASGTAFHIGSQAISNALPLIMLQQMRTAHNGRQQPSSANTSPAGSQALHKE
jgi:hypothetical protein